MTRYLHRLKKRNNARSNGEDGDDSQRHLQAGHHHHQLYGNGWTSEEQVVHIPHVKRQDKTQSRLFHILSSHKKLEGMVEKGQGSIEDVDARLAERSKEDEVYIVEGGIV